VELKRQCKELLAAKTTAQGTFFLSVLRNEGNYWYEFCKYVKRWKGNKEIFPAIKDHNRTTATDLTEKANALNSYYASVFCYNHNILKTQLANLDETVINTKIIRKRLAKIRRNKSVKPDRFPGEIMK
jgi:hypothetical protein